MANEDDDDIDEIEEGEELEVPDGAAFFPIIPAELHLNPALLAVLHTVVFLAGSADNIVHPAAGEEALQGLAEYLSRLSESDRDRWLADLKALRDHAKEQGWPKQLSGFLKDFPKDFGLTEDE